MVGISMPTAPKHRCGLTPEALAMPALADQRDRDAQSRTLLRRPSIVEWRMFGPITQRPTLAEAGKPIVGFRVMRAGAAYPAAV